MSVPAPYSALFSPSDGSFSASRTTASIDLGTGAGRALLVLAMGDGGTPAAYSFTSATVSTMGSALTAGTEKTTTGSVRRAFWGTDSDGLPTGSQTITVNSNGTRNMYIMCVVYKDGAASGASIAVTPTVFASTSVSGGANSYTVNSTTTAGLAVAIAAIAGNLGADASSTNASTYNRYAGGQSFETFSKAGSAGSTAITWQTAGGATIFYDTFGFALLGSTAGDTTAPILTSPTGASTGTTTATVGATTDEGNGTMYAVVTTSVTQPSAAQIKAGQDNASAAAAYAGSQAVSSIGAKTFSATGLTAATAYYAHIIHTDAAGNDSNRVSTASVTTDAGGGSPPPPPPPASMAGVPILIGIDPLSGRAIHLI